MQAARRIPLTPQNLIFANTYTPTIMEEILANEQRHKNTRIYSQRFKYWALGIALISVAAYNAIRRHLPLPSYRTCLRFQHDIMKQSPDHFRNISMIPEIIRGLNKKYFTQDDRPIHGFLAVDALSVTTAVKIDSNGAISGLLGSHVISEHDFNDFLSTTFKFENYLCNVSGSIVTAAFVFQFQPINPSIPTMLLHIMATSSGKADKKVLKRIRDIQDIIRSIDTIMIIGITTDADSGFRSLTQEMIFQTNSCKFKPGKCFDYPLFVSDPLHVLKRYRSHFIKGIHQRDDRDEYLQHFQLEYNFPSAVFSDDTLMKMHDSLPIRLFDLTSIHKSHEKTTHFNSGRS